MAATEVPDDCSDASTEQIEFTEADIDDILDGEHVTRGGYTFSLGSERTDSVDWTAFSVTWSHLRNGDKEHIKWSDDVIVVLANRDNSDPFNPDRDINTNELSTIDDSETHHVTMEVTVDVSDMDDDGRAVIATLAEQYEDSFREVVAKNRDYSWSFLTTGTKLTQSAGTPFDSPTRSQAYGLLTRAGDKRERLVENVYGDGDAAVSDDPSVTAMEAANYYQFLAFILANPTLAEAVSDA